jgi:hypothetical protein
MLRELEPWCSDIYLDYGSVGRYSNEYRVEEQPNTQFNLDNKIWMYGDKKPRDLKNNIVVEFDCRNLNANNFQTIVNLSEILQQSGEVGEMEYDIFKFYIKSLETYEKNLIVCKTN